jgi:hypothetical protein
MCETSSKWRPNPLGWLALSAMGLGLGGAGCQPAEVKECRDRYLVTHAQVAAVDPQDLASVESALTAVQSNLDVCERASLVEESKQLGIAKRKLESHQSYLHSRGSQKELTAEQLDALEKNGDPDCPRGQQYQYKKSGKKIRCTGTQILSMNFAEAKAYFGGVASSSPIRRRASKPRWARSRIPSSTQKKRTQPSASSFSRNRALRGKRRSHA